MSFDESGTQQANRVVNWDQNYGIAVVIVTVYSTVQYNKSWDGSSRARDAEGTVDEVKLSSCCDWQKFK